MQADGAGLRMSSTDRDVTGEQGDAHGDPPTLGDARQFHQTPRERQGISFAKGTYERVAFAHQIVNSEIVADFDPAMPQTGYEISYADIGRLLLKLVEQADPTGLPAHEERLARLVQDAIRSFSKEDFVDRSQPRYRCCPECDERVQEKDWKEHHQECIIKKHGQVDEDRTGGRDRKVCPFCGVKKLEDKYEVHIRRCDEA